MPDKNIPDDRIFYIAAGVDSCWEVLPQRNMLKLYSQGAVLASRQLEPRLMRLLSLLSQAAGEVLTREHLMSALWPRVVVNENSLTRAVSELRKTLSLADMDKSELKSELIETVPKRGYRLTTQVLTDLDAQQYLPRLPQPGSLLKPAHKSNREAGAIGQLSVFRTGYLRHAAIAASMVVTAALSSVWTLKLNNGHDALIGGEPLLGSTVNEHILDRVITEQAELPAGLRWLESVHIESAPALQPQVRVSSGISGTVLAPGGEFLAFVEEFPGQSQLKLRSLDSPDEAWTVFTASSPITHLQWSPLDAGLLFTVEDKELTSTDYHVSARLARLMLLDLETLEVRELYRRAVPLDDSHIKAAGSLT